MRQPLFVLLILFLLTLACAIGPTPQPGKPSVALASPLTETVYQVGQAVPVQAAIADPNGLTRVELRVDGQPIKTDDINPPAAAYTVNHSWTPDVPGSHIVEIRAYNVGGAVNEPAQVIFKVSQEGGQAQATPTPETLVTPTTAPTSESTTAPTSVPTSAPTSEPTAVPTSTPTTAPTSAPTIVTMTESTPTPVPTQPIPVITSFTADPPTITSGGVVVLSWTTVDARDVALHYSNRYERMGNSFYSVSPTTTSQYELIVTNQTGGEARAMVTVNVLSPTPGPIDPAIPVIELTADPAVLAVGDCTTIHWRVIGPATDVRLFYEAVPPEGTRSHCPEEAGGSGFTIQAFGPDGVIARQDITVKAVGVLAKGTGVIPNSSSLDIDMDGGIDLYRDGAGVAAKVNEGPPADYNTLTLAECFNQVYHPDVPLGPYPNQASCLITSQNRIGKFQLLSVDPNGVMTIEYTVWDLSPEDAPGYSGG